MAGRPGNPGGPRRTLPERLERLRHVNDITNCWEWTGAIDHKGYGRITVNRKLTYTHRVAWELAAGSPIPPGMMIDHVCENRCCFNPAHLDIVTPQENTNRRRNSPASRTHCPEGHRYAGENLRIWTDKNGYPHRHCATCNKIRGRQWREAKRRASQ